MFAEDEGSAVRSGRHTVLKVELYQMMEDRDGSVDHRQLKSNLEDMHMKI